jgi:hypothetical protein
MTSQYFCSLIVPRETFKIVEISKLEKGNWDDSKESSQFQATNLRH